jgi:hypothetical protein
MSDRKRREATLTETATEALQGRTWRPVLLVLIYGLVLVFLAWGAAEWWGEATDAPAQQTTTSGSVRWNGSN